MLDDTMVSFSDCPTTTCSSVGQQCAPLLGFPSSHDDNASRPEQMDSGAEMAPGSGNTIPSSQWMTMNQMQHLAGVNANLRKDVAQQNQELEAAAKASNANNTEMTTAWITQRVQEQLRAELGDEIRRIEVSRILVAILLQYSWCT